MISDNIAFRMDKEIKLFTVLFRLGHQGSVMQLSKDTLEGEQNMDDIDESGKAARDKKVEPHPILRYLRNHVSYTINTVKPLYKQLFETEITFAKKNYLYR